MAEKATELDALPLPLAAAGPPSPGGRCLLVDDDQVGALVSEHLLARIGFDVDRASSFAEATQAIARNAYDAVVADYLLPDGTGPEIVDASVAAGRSCGTRFVALTANAEAVNASEAVLSRFHAVLAKPTDMATLAGALRSGGRAPAAGAPRQGCGPDGLAGLSEATIHAMAAAFHAQWVEFRRRLAVPETGEIPEGLADVAHRLAGTTAQLGLTELEAPLRDLEQCCRDEADDLASLLASLDRPLETVPSWQRLAMHGVSR